MTRCHYHRSLILALSAVAFTAAWMPSDVRPSPRESSASRHSTKWEKKQRWLEKRDMRAGDSDETSKAPFATIIGNGRIGSTLAEAGNCIVLGRDDNIDENGKGPILIATRNDALDGIIEKCPESRKCDLVFLQNGYLNSYLEQKGLLDNTQVLLYLSVTAIGAEAVDGVTAYNPEGLTAATGIHAEAFARRLSHLGLRCNVVDAASFKPAMFEKLMWIAVFMLIGAAKRCKSVGQAGSEHSGLVDELINELSAAVEKREAIQFPEGTVPRLNAYTDVVSDFPAAVKEFTWRNKYFFDLGDEEVPIHNTLLRECREGGLLDFSLE
ncbi:unnamed protein product [Cylindrotheca closterium]|uniref:Uncharacterized protein n=1 Tax=Cylindrotheca closterium TaxID=2856 RepID=A0AAD2G8L5_9STRA|nr:unnamed protein product [Cylindrotheca closterium]